MTLEQIILEEFRKDIESEGLFWRIHRPDTFVDLLMVEAYITSSQGFNMVNAISVVITSLKAIINDRYGAIDTTLNFEEMNQLVLVEKDRILSDARALLIENLNDRSQFVNSHTDDLNYFKVLNNLSIENYSIKVFEDILKSSLAYIATYK